jgi:hypothetical protein
MMKTYQRAFRAAHASKRFFRGSGLAFSIPSFNAAELIMLQREGNVLIAMSNNEAPDNQKRTSLKTDGFSMILPLDIYFNAGSHWQLMFRRKKYASATDVNRLTGAYKDLVVGAQRPVMKRSLDGEADRLSMLQ